jgi:hypothetical protein
VELALIDGLLRTTGRDLDDLVRLVGDAFAFGAPGSLRPVRYGMVLASESLRSLRRTVRLARLAGMRTSSSRSDRGRRRSGAAGGGDVAAGLRSGRMTLRLDANAGWDWTTAVEALNRWRDVPIVGVEQPLHPRAPMRQLVELRRRTGARIIHDESLVTMEDAERLHALGVADAFNIRVSKCGGMMPALQAGGVRAGARCRTVQLGCMVGETSILSSAGVRYLGCVPGVRFCEGAFGGVVAGRGRHLPPGPLRYRRPNRPESQAKAWWGGWRRTCCTRIVWKNRS